MEVCIYKIHLFDEACFPLTMVTKLVKVVTYHKELPLKNLHDTSMEWSFEAM